MTRPLTPSAAGTFHPIGHVLYRAIVHSVCVNACTNEWMPTYPCCVCHTGVTLCVRGNVVSRRWPRRRQRRRPLSAAAHNGARPGCSRFGRPARTLALGEFKGTAKKKMRGKCPASTKNGAGNSRTKSLGCRRSESMMPSPGPRSDQVARSFPPRS